MYLAATVLRAEHGCEGMLTPVHQRKALWTASLAPLQRLILSCAAVTEHHRLKNFQQKCKSLQGLGFIRSRQCRFVNLKRALYTLQGSSSQGIGRKVRGKLTVLMALVLSMPTTFNLIPILLQWQLNFTMSFGGDKHLN